MTPVGAATELPPMDVARRTRLVTDELEQRQLDAMLVTKPHNVRWMSGFTGSNGALLITQDAAPVLFTDGRYSEQAAFETAAAGVDVEFVISRTNDADIGNRLTQLGIQSCGIESHHLTVDRFEGLRRSVACELEAVGGLVDERRRCKDEGEIARLRQAASIADEALRGHEALVLAGGVTEREFARSLEATMFELGAEALSFDTIVASGPNTSRPHATPSDRVLLPGDLLLVDFGASVDGYGSDMTRTLVVGGEPTADQQLLYDAVAEAQAAGVAAVRAGAEQVSIDAACRDVLDRHGLADAFLHGTGHGIGLEIHEQPILSARSVGILAADLVVTVEPGAYVSGRGGVRVEDSVLVTSDGCDPITHFPKGLVPWLSQPTI